MKVLNNMRKFKFIHIPKNAGTSFKSLINHNLQLRDFIEYVGHDAPLECFEKNQKTMIVFRDPVERFCSAFHYRLSLLPKCQQWANEKGINSPEKYVQYLKQTMELRNPIKSLRSDQQTVAGHPVAPTVWVFQPQSLWFRSPKCVLLQNNLEAEWKYFCQEARVPFYDLPKKNISQNSLDASGLSLGAESMSFLRHLYSGDYALWELLKNTPLESRIEMNQANF